MGIFSLIFPKDLELTWRYTSHSGVGYNVAAATQNKMTEEKSTSVAEQFFFPFL